MVIKCGVDILQSKRFNKDIKNLGTNFLHKLFSNQELSQNTPVQLASIFCLKEAIIKALGPNSISWLEINTNRKKSGKVLCSFTKKDIATKVISMDTSITHDNGIIVAIATLLMKR